MENFSFLDNLLAAPSPRNSMLMSAPILDPLAEQARKVGTDPFKAPTFSNLAKIREAALADYKPSVPETTGDTTGGGTGGGGTGDSSSDNSGQRELTEAQVMEGMRGTSSGEIEKDAKAAVENLKLLEDLKLVIPITLYLPLKMYFEGKKDAYTYESGMSFRYNDKDEIEKYSDDKTVRTQDVAIFGGYYDKDGKFIVVDKAKAELSKPTTDISNLKSASDTESGSKYQEGTVWLDGQGEVIRSGDGSPVLTGKGDAMMRNGIPITMPTTPTNTPITTPNTSGGGTGANTADPGYITGGGTGANTADPGYITGNQDGMLTGATTSRSVTTPVQPVTSIATTSPVVTTPLQPVTPIAPIYSSGGDSGGGGGSGGYTGTGGYGGGGSLESTYGGGL